MTDQAGRRQCGFETSVPVLIIGGGAAGLCAALAAQEAGAEVAVLERDAVPRGSTALSAGLIPAAATRFQRARGIVDSPELFAADIQRKAHGEADAGDRRSGRDAVRPDRRMARRSLSACRSRSSTTSTIPAIPRGACTACPPAPASN